MITKFKQVHEPTV